MNNYYVYQHVNQEGTIVYVGKGRYARAWRHERRQADHSEWMASQLPLLTVNFPLMNASDTEALAFEKEMIQKLQPKFNNDYTEWSNRKEFGEWLSENHSRFKDSDLQKELGKRAAISSNHPNNTLHKCEHCDAVMNLGHIKRYHNDNCKRRIKLNELD